MIGAYEPSAKGWKKGLYSPDNKGNGKLVALNRLRDQEPVKGNQTEEADVQPITSAEVTLPTESPEVVEIVTSKMAESPQVVKIVTSELASETVKQHTTTEANQSKHNTCEEAYAPALLAQLC